MRAGFEAEREEGLGREAATPVLAGWPPPEEDLSRGIWPRSGPFWMAMFYTALFIMRPWEKLLPELGDLHFQRIYALLMIAVVLMSSRARLKTSFQSLAVLLFTLSITLSCMFAVDPSLAWTVLYDYLTLVIFYFILVSVIRSPYELVLSAVIYVAIMAVYLAKSQWEFFIHGEHRYDMGVVRMVGMDYTFGGPNSLAMSIVVSLPVLYFCWVHRDRIAAGWPPFWRKWFPRLLAGYGVLALTSIILTNSRSGMVAGILFVLLVALRGKGAGRKLGYLFVGVLFLWITWMAMPQESRDRLRTIWDPTAGPQSAQMSASGRISGYKAGIAMFQEFPLFGVGPGNFIQYRTLYVDRVPMNAHNLLGQVLGETGLMGVLTFGLFVALTVGDLRKTKALARPHAGTDTALRLLFDLSTAFLNAMVLLAFEGLFGHNLLRFHWLWMAAFALLARQFAGERADGIVSSRGAGGRPDLAEDA